jgi:diguanylate cyclase (GGDEF)-like protein
MERRLREAAVLGKANDVTRSAHKTQKSGHPPEPELSVVCQNQQEIWGIRILLLIVAMETVVSFLMPRLSSQVRLEISFLPQLLTVFVVLVLMLDLRVMSQRKSLRSVSKALLDSISYIDRLEDISLIDPQTQTFSRSFLYQLFSQQSKSSNRAGTTITLCLIEVRPDQQPVASSVSEENVANAGSVLRANFRGSDYIVRYTRDQFLVLLPDTNQPQAQIALDRLNSKVEFWNLDNESSSISLRQEMISCLPGEDLWVRLSEMEKTLQEEAICA